MNRPGRRRRRAGRDHACHGIGDVREVAGLLAVPVDLAACLAGTAAANRDVTPTYGDSDD